MSAKFPWGEQTHSQPSVYLKWPIQINKMCTKANSTLGFIRRNLKHCNKKFKEAAYLSLVRSVLNYSASVWPWTTTCRIESIQRRGARFVTKRLPKNKQFNIYYMETSCTSKKRTNINLTSQDHQRPVS